MDTLSQIQNAKLKPNRFFINKKWDVNYIYNSTGVEFIRAAL